MRIATAAQIAAIDRLAEEKGLPAHDLVEPAGGKLAEAIIAEAERRGAKCFTFLIGPGKNGADGFVAARRLIESGYRATAILPGGEASLGAVCREKKERYLAADGVFTEGIDEAAIKEADILVDALFGTGLSRDITGLYAEAIIKIKQAGKPVIAVDLPSGLDTDTGEVRGIAAEAILTVTFTLPKPAHFLADHLTGRTEVVDFGIPEEIILSEAPFAAAFDGEEAKKLLLPRDPLSHKGRYGKAVLFVGGRGYSGAAAMATGAAVRSGCGLVWSMVPECVYPIAASAVHEAITLPLEDDRDGSFAACALEDGRMLEAVGGADAFLIGSGVIPGATAGELLEKLLATGKKLVIDAGALNFLAGGNKDGRGEHIHFEDKRLHDGVILTPHMGELLRIMGGKLPCEANALLLARRLAAESGAVMVMKGHRTVIASPDGRVFLNTTGNAGMAKGGSGDVLAGTIAGLAARMPAFEAAALGAWLCGRAGDLARDLLGENGMTAEDCVRLLPKAAKLF